MPVDRASPADLMQLATDVGPAPMHVGAVLILGTGPGFSVQEAQQLLGERVRDVPRLRQRLRRAPPGCGRPFWADDPAFDLRHHVRQLPCPPPGDERALLDVAAAVTRELERMSVRLAAEREDRARLVVAGERSRIARELHAVIARSVAAMVVQSHW